MENEKLISIITPTYRRPDKLSTAITSVISQGYRAWEMIIVNDDPDFSLSSLVASYNDSRITLFENKENLGANASRNRGLSLVSSNSDQILFLDDDDLLAPNALDNLFELVFRMPEEQWIVTNRFSKFGDICTRASKHSGPYIYSRDYLLFRRIKGDATHLIATKLATSAQFSTSIKNGEEWLYYFEISKRSRIWYQDINTTLTEGYAATGLNFRKRNSQEQIRTLGLLVTEGYKRGLIADFYFLTYILIRLLRACVK